MKDLELLRLLCVRKCSSDPAKPTTDDFVKVSAFVDSNAALKRVIPFNMLENLENTDDLFDYYKQRFADFLRDSVKGIDGGLGKNRKVTRLIKDVYERVFIAYKAYSEHDCEIISERVFTECLSLFFITDLILSGLTQDQKERILAMLKYLTGLIMLFSCTDEDKETMMRVASIDNCNGIDFAIWTAKPMKKE